MLEGNPPHAGEHPVKVLFRIPELAAPSLPAGHSKVRCGVRSGSGWVVVVPLDKGERGGSNGVKIIVCLWVLRWLGGSEDEA
jgi:hypothetical protein